MTAVRVFYWASVLVMGAFAVPVTSYLDTHRRADLLWAVALFALGLALALVARMLRGRVDPAERQPITSNSRRSAAFSLWLGVAIGAFGIATLWAELASGGGGGQVLIAIGVIAIATAAFFDAWRKYQLASEPDDGDAAES